MKLAASVAVAAAERVERTGGARAGLAVWRTMADNAVDVEARAVAVLSALRCAVVLRDAAAFEAVLPGWPRVREGIHVDVFARVREAALGGLLPQATALARAEVGRLRSARALYALARCLERGGDDEAAEATYADAAARADNEGRAEIASAARLRRAKLLAARHGTVGPALEEARRVDPEHLAPRERVTLARVLLRAPSRFVRAGAIDLLDPVVAGADARLASRALVLLAEHADDAGDDLTPMEVDRLRALFARPSVSSRAQRAREALEVRAGFARAASSASAEEAVHVAMDRAAALDPALGELHARARDLVAGRFEAHAAAAHPVAVLGATAPWSDLWAAVLDLAFAVRDDKAGRAVLVLRALSERARAGAAIPVQVWTPLATALASEAADARAAALDLAESLLASPSRRAPPRGWMGIAGALVVAGREDLAEVARRAATARGEPGAAAALGETLVRAAWRAVESGDRARAITLLREARALETSRSP